MTEEVLDKSPGESALSREFVPSVFALSSGIDDNSSRALSLQVMSESISSLTGSSTFTLKFMKYPSSVCVKVIDESCASIFTGRDRGRLIVVMRDCSWPVPKFFPQVF